MDIVRVLVERGADVNAVYEWTPVVRKDGSRSGYLRTTALGLAVAAEQAETARFLAVQTDTKSDLLRLLEPPDYVHPLCIACLVGGADVITSLLDAGANVIHADDTIVALSHYGRMQSLSFGMPHTDSPSSRLLGRQQRCEKSQTLLQLAIGCFDMGVEEYRLVKLCESLILKGTRVDGALVMAVEVEKIQAVKLLLGHGASVGPRSHDEPTPFGLAIEKGNLELARILHQAGTARTGPLRYIKGVAMAEFLEGIGLLRDALIRYWPLLLPTAISRGQEARWLLDRILGSTRSVGGDSSGSLATEAMCTSSVNFLLESKHWRVVHIIDTLKAAIAVDSLDIVQFLLCEAMRVTEDAALFNRKEVLEPVIRAVVHQGSRQALQIILSGAGGRAAGCLGKHLPVAIRRGDSGVVRDMIAAGAAVNHQGRYGSPLCAAVLKVLFPDLQFPAEFSDISNRPPSRFQGQPMEVLEMLLNAGADISLSLSRESKTCLELAASYGNLAMVEFLLRKGANPNIPPAPARGPGRRSRKHRKEDISRLCAGSLRLAPTLMLLASTLNLLRTNGQLFYLPP